MTIRKLHGSWWVDFRVDGKRYRRRSPENSPAGARAYERVLHAKIVRREIFDRLRGYRDIPIFEDLDFSHRLRALGKTITLTPPVYSSARRFAEKGPLRTTWDDLRLTRRYLSGVDPNELCLPGVHRIKHLQTYERLS